MSVTVYCLTLVQCIVGRWLLLSVVWRSVFHCVVYDASSVHCRAMSVMGCWVTMRVTVWCVTVCVWLRGMHHDVLLSVVSEDECCIAWCMTPTAFLSRGMMLHGVLWQVVRCGGWWVSHCVVCDESRDDVWWPGPAAALRNMDSVEPWSSPPPISPPDSKEEHLYNIIDNNNKADRSHYADQTGMTSSQQCQMEHINKTNTQSCRQI